MPKPVLKHVKVPQLEGSAAFGCGGGLQVSENGGGVNPAFATEKRVAERFLCLGQPAMDEPALGRNRETTFAAASDSGTKMTTSQFPQYCFELSVTEAYLVRQSGSELP